MECFASCNIFYNDNVQLIRNIALDETTRLDYRPDPSFMNWICDDGKSGMMLQRIPTKIEIDKYKQKYTQAYELLIVAIDNKIAEDVNGLIHGGRLLAYPCTYSNPQPKWIRKADFDCYQKEDYVQHDINANMLFSCLVAAKCWKDKSLIYCIEKYRFSIELDWFTPHSASPIYGQVFSIDDRGYSYHVRAAYAFISAYSIIEELGLDIRSSSKKPRFLENGEWNPTVKTDILERLSKIGISENDSIVWIIRGIPSELYKSIKPKLGINTKWTDGVVVHDQQMKIYDAIHYCSYIRNFFLAHKFNEVVSYINPYDIHNIQCLVRRLIMSKIGLWNYDENNPQNYISN